MASTERKKKLHANLRADLPRGVTLFRTLEGHGDAVFSLSFSPDGERLVSASADRTIKFWDIRKSVPSDTFIAHRGAVRTLAFDPQGETLVSGGVDGGVNVRDVHSRRTLRLEGHDDTVWSVALDGRGTLVASASGDYSVKLWDRHTGALLRTLIGQPSIVWTVAFDPRFQILASGNQAGVVALWDARTGEHLGTFEGHLHAIASVAFDPHGRILASGSGDRTVKLWEPHSGTLLRTLEGHTGLVEIVAFSPDGRLLASKSEDHTIRLWSCDTWETVAVIEEPTSSELWIPTLAFHPTQPLLATAGSDIATPEKERCRLIHLWRLDYDVLLDKRPATASAGAAVHHTTAKVVLVGDNSVGKSTLGHRMIHGVFQAQPSTHGQQFWVFAALGKRRADGTDCEAILWDFAGQPDYRLVHALFVDNADLALVLFDAANLHDPLHGVGFWLKQLQLGKNRCPIVLVAARTDRGSSSLTQTELEAFCQSHGIVGPVATSALTGFGVEDLVDRMKSLISWDDKPGTVTTTTFKRIKDYVLGLKEERQGQVIATPEELRARLQATDAQWEFTDPEMLTAVGHLENYGYVKRLKTSKGELRILLQPERLNNLASSFVLEARRNPKGLGALEEKPLFAGGYDFPELKDLSSGERDVLLDSAVLLFLEHNVCFRETDPLRGEPYLVFPELINLKKPPGDDGATEDGAAYTVSGPTENVFASLVVLLGYTHTFTRTAQWHNNARYEVGEGLVCGFRQESERDGQLDFVLCFAPRVGAPVRTLFQGLFESFLARRNLTVTRFEPLRCSNDHLLNRAVVREAMQRGDETTFCSRCGKELTLPKMAEPIQLTRDQRAEVDSQRRAAEQRTRFEQAVFRVCAYITDHKIKPPACFISYAWGVTEHERWVEKRLAADLHKAGIAVLLDRWDNAQIGSSIARFVERIEECDRVVVVGTPLYRQKAKNLASPKGSVVAAEWDVAGIRLLATEEQKRTVLPVLLEGDESESLPPLLRGRVYGDFRKEEAYFTTAFDLILSLYQLPPNHSAVADLRESLREPGLR